MRPYINDLLCSLKGSWVGKIVACVLYPLMYWPLFVGQYVNALICERLVNAWPRIGGVGLYKTAAELTRELVANGRFTTVVLGGNEAEQKQFLAEYRPEWLTSLDVSDGTYPQVRGVVDYAEQYGLPAICIITHESLLTRAALTVVKQLKEREMRLPVYCEAYLDLSRLELKWYEVTLASANEALSLLRYQRRGHVATHRETLEYLRDVSWEERPGGVLFVIV